MAPSSARTLSLRRPLSTSQPWMIYMVATCLATIVMTVSAFSTPQSLSLLPHQPTHLQQLPPSHGRHVPLSITRTQLFSATKDETSERDLKTSLDPKDDHPNDNDHHKKRYIPRTLMRIYVNYVTKLWRQTNPEEREKVAAQKALYAVRRVKHIMEGEEYVDVSHVKDGETWDEVDKRIVARDKLLESCNVMLECLEDGELEEIIAADNENYKNGKKEMNAVGDKSLGKKKKKKSRSILFGASMGAAVTGWVFSGNFLFTALFTLMTALGQLEYYRMVMKTGIYPARRISVMGACAMFVTALFAPSLHQICLPVFATYAMIWFLTMRRTVTTIPEIATTFTGMFYLGYIPSFWVRIRLLGGYGPTRLAPLLGPILETLGQQSSALPTFLPKFVHLPITSGAVFIFWTWISIAFSDVGAYFAGRKFGKTKLGKIAPAAGAASPNKTVEGFIGGSLFAAAFATAGAWVMHWPSWYITGPLHGISLAFLGLVGDLTASMLKRDSGLKDFGDLLPEHGGIMDRVDSFIFTAPYSWLVVQFLLPALKARSRLAIP